MVPLAAAARALRTALAHERDTGRTLITAVLIKCLSILASPRGMQVHLKLNSLAMRWDSFFLVVSHTFSE
jgi:hypothetical protein